jgi:hypothetical protein
MGRFDASKTAPKQGSAVNNNVSGKSRYLVAAKASELRIEENDWDAIQDDDVTVRAAFDSFAEVTIALTL